MQNPTQAFKEFELELMAAYSEVCREEKRRDNLLTERRRAAENARVERELMRDLEPL